MSEYFEEEEFTTEFNGRTLLRILGLTKPLLAVGSWLSDWHCAGIGAGFVFHLSRQSASLTKASWQATHLF